jgi:hypothetical protein
LLQANCLLEFLFQAGHLDEKRGAVKPEISFAPMLVRKRFAAWSMNDPLAGLLKFMGNAVQSADHGAEPIKPTKTVAVERTHKVHSLPFFIGQNRLAAYLCGFAFYLVLFFPIERFETFQYVKVFQQGVMIKPSQAAVVLAAGTIKTIVVCGFIVFAVHGGIYRF